MSLSNHLRRKNGIPLNAVEVGIGPHVDEEDDEEANLTLSEQPQHDKPRKTLPRVREDEVT